MSDFKTEAEIKTNEESINTSIEKILNKILPLIQLK